MEESKKSHSCLVCSKDSIGGCGACDNCIKNIKKETPQEPPGIVLSRPLSKRRKTDRITTITEKDITSITETPPGIDASIEVQEEINVNTVIGRRKDKSRSRSIKKKPDDPKGRRSSILSSGCVGNSESTEPFPQAMALTSYLEEVHKPTMEPRMSTDSPTTLYGQTVPPEAPEDVCSGCHGARDLELEDKEILLCDGPGCNREYHLECCVPPLQSVPDKESWLCRDCCPDGTAASLIEYFEAADQAKAEFLRENATEKDPYLSYIVHLILEDSDEPNKSEFRYPQSELDRSSMIHSLAMSDPNHLARTRGGSEKNKALRPSSYLGKPIRIYNPLGNHYHTGRIVNFRSTGNVFGEMDESETIYSTEFLVRFAAGVDERKKGYQHWIMLEEHSLACGSSLVWAQVHAGIWSPAILWLRTSRELVPVKNLLKEKEGEIVYVEPKGKNTEADKFPSPCKTIHRVFVLARTLGEHSFSLVNVRNICVDISDAAATEKFLAEPQNVLQYHLAQAELAEQKKVQKWHALKQVDPVGPAVFSSRDWYGLPPLIPISSEKKIRTASLCPNVSHGLDRSKILKLLSHRGIAASRDVAASLSCEVISVTANTLVAEQVGRKGRKSTNH